MAPYLIQNARVFAGAGFAVLRYDPPGVGRATGSLANADHSLDDFGAGYQKAHALADGPIRRVNRHQRCPKGFR